MTHFQDISHLSPPHTAKNNENNPTDYHPTSPQQRLSIASKQSGGLGSPTKDPSTLAHKSSVSTRLNKIEEQMLPGMIPMSLEEARTHATCVHDRLLSKMAAFMGQLHIFEDVVLASAFQNLVDLAQECVTQAHNLSVLVHSISALSKALWAPTDAFGRLMELQRNLDKLLAQFAAIQNLGSQKYVPMKGTSSDHRNTLTQLSSDLVATANKCLVAVFYVLDIAPSSTVVQIWRAVGITRSDSDKTLSAQSKHSVSASLTDSPTSSSMKLPDLDDLTANDCDQSDHQPSPRRLELTDPWVPPSVHAIVEPFGDGVLARSEDGRMLGGDMIGLVSSLCRQSLCCASDIGILLQNFRAFCTPQDFLALILDQFYKSAMVTGRRCLFRLLYTWVSQYWYAPLDVAVLPTLLAFAQEPYCKSLQPSTESLSSVCAYRLQQGDNEYLNDPFRHSLPVFDMKKLPKTMSHRLLNMLRQKRILWEIDVLEFDPAELARQITLRESTLFCQISVHELLNRRHDYKDSSYRSQAIHVREMSLLSTQLTNWLGECILREKDLKRRSQKLRFFILLAFEALELGNFNLVMALLGGLNLSTIGRLKNTWGGVSARKRARLEKLCKIFDTTRNFRAYRALLRETEGPAIPFLGLILTDITFCCNGNPVMRSFPSCTEPLINFARCQLLSDIFSSMKRFQRVYPIEAIPEMQSFLQQVLQQGSNYTPNDYPAAMEHMYQRSLALEPRNSLSDMSSTRKGNVMARTLSAILNSHGSSSLNVHDEKETVPMSRTSSNGSASSASR